MIEILIAIGIMLFLMTLLIVAGGAIREWSNVAKTRSTLKAIALALDTYHANHNNNWPTIPVVGDPNPDTCPYSTITPLQADAAFWKGIDLEKSMLAEAGMEFKSGELDSSGYFVDAWGNRIRYRKNRDHYLVWSLGPPRGNPLQFHDDIGSGDYYDANTKTFKTPPGPITHLDVDTYVTSTGAKYVGPNLSVKD
jgi:type II secretory pathway pseudopilin PulG